MHNKGVVKERLSKKVTIATEDMVSAAALYKTSNVASLPVGLRETHLDGLKSSLGQM
jgi:hypothetical protein